MGIAVFGKAIDSIDYSTAEDSAVRVHVRHLQPRIHEFFAQEGRNEALRVDIPKGSYALEFHDAPLQPAPLLSPPSLLSQAEPAMRTQSRFKDLLFWMALATAAFCAFGWYHTAKAIPLPSVPWPLNAVIQPDRQTRVVVFDSSTMLRLLSQQQTTLDEYLQPGYRESLIPPTCRRMLLG